MSLDRYLQEIEKEDKPLRYGALVALSGMSRLEMDKFSRMWQGLGLERRCQLLNRLVGMAEENVDLDFNPIYLMCLDSPDPKVREKAILGLWEFEDRSLIGTLLEVLSTDVVPRVRSAAAITLGKFAVLAEEGKLSPKEGQRIKETLISVLKNGKECIEVRRRALESAAPFNTHVVQTFIRQNYESDDLKLSSSALYAMGKTGEPEWLRYLLKEMRSPSPVLRFEAANACGELGEETAVPHLVPLLEDDDLQVQLAAIRALGEIGGTMATRALSRCARSEDMPLREAAHEAMEYTETLKNPLSFRYQVQQ